MINVTNKRHGILLASDIGEYIGRPSPLGNPFVIGTDGDRAEVVNKYRKWIIAELHDSPEGRPAQEFRRLQAIYETTGELTLVCWCKPLACHGDVISEGIIHESA